MREKLEFNLSEGEKKFLCVKGERKENVIRIGGGKEAKSNPEV